LRPPISAVAKPYQKLFLSFEFLLRSIPSSFAFLTANALASFSVLNSKASNFKPTFFNAFLAFLLLAFISSSKYIS